MNALLEYFTANDCSIREYQSKELCTKHLSVLLQYSASTDSSIREYQSIFMELSSIKYPPNILALCWNSTSAYNAGIFVTGLHFYKK